MGGAACRAGPLRTQWRPGRAPARTPPPLHLCVNFWATHGAQDQRAQDAGRRRRRCDHPLRATGLFTPWFHPLCGLRVCGAGGETLGFGDPTPAPAVARPHAQVGDLRCRAWGTRLLGGTKDRVILRACQLGHSCPRLPFPAPGLSTEFQWCPACLPLWPQQRGQNLLVGSPLPLPGGCGAQGKAQCQAAKEPGGSKHPQGLHLIHSFVQLFLQPLWGSRPQETKVDAEQWLAPWRSAPDAFSLRT